MKNKPDRAALLRLYETMIRIRRLRTTSSKGTEPFFLNCPSRPPSPDM